MTPPPSDTDEPIDPWFSATGTDLTPSSLRVPGVDDVPEGVQRLWEKFREAFGFIPNVFRAQALTAPTCASTPATRSPLTSSPSTGARPT